MGATVITAIAEIKFDVESPRSVNDYARLNQRKVIAVIIIIILTIVIIGR